MRVPQRWKKPRVKLVCIRVTMANVYCCPRGLEDKFAQVREIFDPNDFVRLGRSRCVEAETYKDRNVARIPLTDDVCSDLHDLVIRAAVAGSIIVLPLSGDERACVSCSRPHPH